MPSGETVTGYSGLNRTYGFIIYCYLIYLVLAFETNQLHIEWEATACSMVSGVDPPIRPYSGRPVILQ